jgi:hypothetical protein
MSEAVLTSVEETPRRIPLSWLLEIVFYPRVTMKKVAAQTRGVWLAPVLLLTLTAVILVLVTGPVKLADLQSKGRELPADWQYWSPEQQAQFTQSSQQTQSPVFIYVFPALMAVGKVWIGWLLVSGALHLVLTLSGGRSSSTTSLNLVAWAGIPFVIRDLVRMIAIQTSHTLIANPGLSGFALEGAGINLYLSKLLALIDIYVIWHLVILTLGARYANDLSWRKAALSVLIVIILALALQALFAFLFSLLGGLNIARPFLF